MPLLRKARGPEWGPGSGGMDRQPTETAPGGEGQPVGFQMVPSGFPWWETTEEPKPCRNWQAVFSRDACNAANAPQAWCRRGPRLRFRVFRLCPFLLRPVLTCMSRRRPWFLSSVHNSAFWVTPSTSDTWYSHSLLPAAYPAPCSAAHPTPAGPQTFLPFTLCMDRKALLGPGASSAVLPCWEILGIRTRQLVWALYPVPAPPETQSKHCVPSFQRGKLLAMAGI